MAGHTGEHGPRGLLICTDTMHGAFNQRWALPHLRRLAAGGEEPGRAAAILRQSVALEVGFAVVVIVVTSVLVATEPVNPD